jgi:hypothetical protein
MATLAERMSRHPHRTRMTFLDAAALDISRPSEAIGGPDG